MLYFVFIFFLNVCFYIFLLIMFLYITFLYCIGVTLAYKDILDAFQIKEAKTDEQPSTKDDAGALNCEQMEQTSLTPFVVLLLVKTSGRFVGMGSIIDKNTVLSAIPAVSPVQENPTELLVLAGRLGPWWGRGSQVKNVKEIRIHNDAQMALLKTVQPFRYCKTVGPVRVFLKKIDDFEPVFDKHYAVFGIPRSNFDVPGDPAPKSSTYIMKLETMLIKKPDLDPCKFHFLDSNYYPDLHICTTANQTYCWGCIGSPTIALDKGGRIVQIAVVTKVANREEDLFHRHTKICAFANWVRSQSFIRYSDDLS